VPDLDHLLDEFAARFARGERPDPRDYLRRAGEEADELAELIDAFLVAAGPPAPDAETVALMEAWIAGEPPLLELRRRRGQRREAVVEAILGALGIDPAKRSKVAGHYHRLESGLLDTRRVDRRVLDAIAAAIGATVEELTVWAAPSRGTVAAEVYLRSAASPAAGVVAFRADVAEPDEVDVLFGVAG
jgi:hypothetical protein